MVQILQDQFAKGYASGLDLAAQQSQLAQLAATLPTLLKQKSRSTINSRFWQGNFPQRRQRSISISPACNCRSDLPVSLPRRW